MGAMHAARSLPFRDMARPQESVCAATETATSALEDHGLSLRSTTNTIPPTLHDVCR